jgi:hypothetical protein
VVHAGEALLPAPLSNRQRPSRRCPPPRSLPTPASALVGEVCVEAATTTAAAAAAAAAGTTPAITSSILLCTRCEPWPQVQPLPPSPASSSIPAHLSTQRCRYPLCGRDVEPGLSGSITLFLHQPSAIRHPRACSRQALQNRPSKNSHGPRG